MLRRTIPLLALLALVTATGVSAAAERTLNGRAALAARGPLEGDIWIAGPRSGPVHYLVRSGYVAAVSLGRGFEVACDGELQSRRDERGRLRAVCFGETLHVALSGSHFGFAASGARLGALLPDGARATLSGAYSVCASPGVRPLRRLGPARPLRLCLSGLRAGPAAAPPAGPDLELDVNGDGRVDPADVRVLLAVAQ